MISFSGISHLHPLINEPGSYSDSFIYPINLSLLENVYDGKLSDCPFKLII